MARSAAPALQVSGTVVDGAGDRHVTWWLDGGQRHDTEVAGAQTVAENAWIVPGLVDSHNHVGIAPGLGVTTAQARGFAMADACAGALLLREVGSPTDTHPLDADPLCPTIIRAGKHLARPKRYLRDYGVELTDPEDLVTEIVTQAQAGDGWVKLVGDWIDREVGDLAPLWPTDVLVRAVAAAHAVGAKVTAHVFGTEALYGLIEAGVDCIEHGTGLNDELIAILAERQVPVVPTLIQVENFPGIAAGADRFPTYQAHMRALYAGARDVFAKCVDAGVPLYAGTDAGGFVGHGRIVEEIEALTTIGLSAEQALASGSWAARDWLGVAQFPGADLIVLDADPRRDIATLRRPVAVIRNGVVL